jgi:hypothetical protein
MSKRKSTTKTSKTKTITRASAAKTAVTKSAISGASAPALIVLGYDDQQKPRGARFVNAKPDLVAKAADLMDLKVYQATSQTWQVPRNCPSVGFMPARLRAEHPEALYSEVVVALAVDPRQR